ncbi:unnamed protein product [Oikopleura dioica]|uniref:Uncharacterized protein n=1 Tax=Oikopleura dioica TaxID=34765 RepID=E4Y979_OIKDI|nr:unnamed protein product [Oikopleura dioica]
MEHAKLKKYEKDYFEFYSQGQQIAQDNSQFQMNSQRPDFEQQFCDPSTQIDFQSQSRFHPQAPFSQGFSEFSGPSTSGNGSHVSDQQQRPIQNLTNAYQPRATKQAFGAFKNRPVPYQIPRQIPDNPYHSQMPPQNAHPHFQPSQHHFNSQQNFTRVPNAAQVPPAQFSHPHFPPQAPSQAHHHFLAPQQQQQSQFNVHQVFEDVVSSVQNRAQLPSQEPRRKPIGYDFPIKNLQHQETFGSGNWWPLADADFVVNLRVKPGSYLLIFENLRDLLCIVCKLNDFINYYIEGEFLYIVQKSTKKYLRFCFLDIGARNAFLEHAYGFLTQFKPDEDHFVEKAEQASKKIAAERREKILQLKEEQKAFRQPQNSPESSPIRPRAATLDTPKRSSPILKRQNSLGDINDKEKSTKNEENSSRRPRRVSKDAALLLFENSRTAQNAALTQKKPKKKKKDVFEEWKKEKVKNAKEINKNDRQKSQNKSQTLQIPERNRDIYNVDEPTALLLRVLETMVKNAPEWNEEKAKIRQELVDQDFLEEQVGRFGAENRTFWAKNLYQKRASNNWEQLNRPDRRVKMELQRVVRRIEFYVEDTVEIFAGKTGKIDFVFHEKAIYLASMENKTFLRLELDTDEDPNMLKRFLEVGNGLFCVHKTGKNEQERVKSNQSGKKNLPKAAENRGFLVTNVFKMDRIKMREGRLAGSWDRIAAKNEPVEIRLHDNSIEFCVQNGEEHKFLINKKDECRFQRRSNALYLQNYDAKVAYRFEYKNGQEKLHNAFKQLLRRTYAANSLFVCKSRTNIPKPAPEPSRTLPAKPVEKVESTTTPTVEIRPRAATLELIKPEKVTLKRQKSLAELDKIPSLVKKQPFRKRRNAETEIELSESSKIESRYPFTPIEANKIDTSKWNFQKKNTEIAEKPTKKESKEQFQLSFDEEDSQNREKFEEHRKEDRIRRKRTKMLRKEKRKLKKESLSSGLDISTSEKDSPFQNENYIADAPPSSSATQQQPPVVVQQPQVVVAGVQMLHCKICRSQQQVLYKPGATAGAILCCICVPICGWIYCCTRPGEGHYCVQCGTKVA